jgi:Flp pilus assembly protein TadG
MPDAHALIAHLKTLAHAQRGNSAIEFGLLAPILILLTIGVVDLGVGLYQQQQVQAAAQAGAQAALSGGSGVNTGATSYGTNIENAATNSTSLSVTATVPNGAWSGCPTGTSITPPKTGSTTCTGGANPNTYVTVNTTATYKPLLSYPGFGSSVTLNGTATVRVK